MESRRYDIDSALEPLTVYNYWGIPCHGQQGHGYLSCLEQIESRL